MGKTKNTKTKVAAARKQTQIKNKFQFSGKSAKKLENCEKEVDTMSSDNGNVASTKSLLPGEQPIFRYPVSPPHPAIKSYGTTPLNDVVMEDNDDEKSEIARNYDAYNEKKDAIKEKFEKFVSEKYQNRVNVINQVVSKIGLKLVKTYEFGSFDLRKIQEKPNSFLTYFGHVKVFPKDPIEPVDCKNYFEARWSKTNDKSIPRTDSPDRIEQFMSSKFCRIKLEGIPEMMYITRFGPIDKNKDYCGYDYHSYMSISEVIKNKKELDELITEMLHYKENPYGKNENVVSSQSGPWRAGGLTLTINDQMNRSVVIGKVNMENIMDYSQSDGSGDFLLIKPVLTREGVENLSNYFTIKNKDVDDGSVKLICKPFVYKMSSSPGKVTNKEKLFFNNV